MVYHFKEKKRCLKNQLWDNFYNFALKQLHECLLSSHVLKTLSGPDLLGFYRSLSSKSRLEILGQFLPAI